MLIEIPVSTIINAYQIIVHSGISAFFNIILAFQDSYIYIYKNCKLSREG